MRRLVIIYSLLLMGIGVYAQSKPVSNRSRVRSAAADSVRSLDTTTQFHQLLMLPDSMITNEDSAAHFHAKMILSIDSLTMSDYMLGIERVNDQLNAIADSAKLGFGIVKMGRRIAVMTEDVQQIRQNVRGRRAVFNIKNQYLYQSFTAKMDEETDRIQAKLELIYQRVYHAKLHLRDALSDSVFRKVYADRKLRTTFNQKLVRLERKWDRTDSITRTNVDTLNAMKVRLSDNSVTLSGMGNILDARMDKALPKLFGPEETYLWGADRIESQAQEPSKSQTSIYASEKNALGYYLSQTLGERIIVFVLGIVLFTWLFFKRKLLKSFKDDKDSFGFMHLRYLNNYPVLSLVVLLLCLMPFFDAYAPVSYISIFYVLLLTASTVIFFRLGDSLHLFNWFVLMALLVADVLAYLFIEPKFAERLLLLAIHAGILVFTIRFYRSLFKDRPFYSYLKFAAITGIILSGSGILLNLFGRFSLSGIVGMAGIFAVTQAVVLTVFVEVVIEIILLQLQSSRLKKGIDLPFETGIVVNKIKMPLIVIAVLIWLIMLTSNLNIYHFINTGISEALTSTRSIGSISFQWVSVILFFVIIWSAHILQRLLSFIFGETGTDTEDVTTITKGQHSRLLITRLLVLIGGYLLAIAASGLPVDKLTFLLGAMGLGIGMGLQNIINNFVSGIILIFDGSLQIGDEIESSGQAGRVKEIGLRASTLTTADGADVIIPNGIILSQNIVNWTFSNNEKRIMITFTLSGKELDANVINDVINGTIKELPNVIEKRTPVILYTKVSSESCSLTIRFWSTISNVDLVKSEAMLRLNAAFAAKQIGFE